MNRCHVHAAEATARSRSRPVLLTVPWRVILSSPIAKPSKRFSFSTGFDVLISCAIAILLVPLQHQFTATIAVDRAEAGCARRALLPKLVLFDGMRWLGLRLSDRSERHKGPGVRTQGQKSQREKSTTTSCLRGADLATYSISSCHFRRAGSRHMEFSGQAGSP